MLITSQLKYYQINIADNYCCKVRNNLIYESFRPLMLLTIYHRHWPFDSISDTAKLIPKSVQRHVLPQWNEISHGCISNAFPGAPHAPPAWPFSCRHNQRWWFNSSVQLPRVQLVLMCLPKMLTTSTKNDKKKISKTVRKHRPTVILLRAAINGSPSGESY